MSRGGGRAVYSVKFVGIGHGRQCLSREMTSEACITAHIRRCICATIDIRVFASQTRVPSMFALS